MPVKFPIKPFTYQQLGSAANPSTTNQPESIGFIFYDSQDFASNFSPVSFFTAVQSDVTLGNIQVANSLSADQYFQLWAITLDWLIGATTIASSAAATIVDDLLGIYNTARAIATLAMSYKTMLQAPIHNFHSSGNVYVNFQLGTPSGSGIGNYASSWMPDGGHNVGGSIILAPRQVFTFQIAGTGTVTLNATRKGRISFHGVLARKVV